MIDDKWNDFEVVKHGELSSAAEQYKSYLILKSHIEKLPRKELINRGWISETMPGLLEIELFKNIHRDRSSALYRKNDNSNDTLVSLWMSHLKSTAEITCLLETPDEFVQITKDDLRIIARMSPDSHVIQRLPQILLDYGIILIYQKTFSGMKLDGASFKLSNGTPVIGLSLRFNRLDNFWFTLMHELSHLCLHYDLLDNPILDDLDTDTTSDIESAANRLAKESFVERAVWRSCEPKYDNSVETLKRFAHKISIHPAIIAGMIRKESGNHTIYNSIIHAFNTREEIFGND